MPWPHRVIGHDPYFQSHGRFDHRRSLAVHQFIDCPQIGIVLTAAVVSRDYTYLQSERHEFSVIGMRGLSKRNRRRVDRERESVDVVIAVTLLMAPYGVDCGRTMHCGVVMRATALNEPRCREQDQL